METWNYFCVYIVYEQGEKPGIGLLFCLFCFFVLLVCRLCRFISLYSEAFLII